MQEELGKFESMAEEWWDVDGPFKPLIAMHPPRVRFLRSALCEHFGRAPSQLRPLEGLRALDIGCGAGLLSQSLARLGAKVRILNPVAHGVQLE